MTSPTTSSRPSSDDAFQTWQKSLETLPKPSLVPALPNPTPPGSPQKTAGAARLFTQPPPGDAKTFKAFRRLGGGTGPVT